MKMIDKAIQECCGTCDRCRGINPDGSIRCRERDITGLYEVVLREPPKGCKLYTPKKFYKGSTLSDEYGIPLFRVGIILKV